MTIALADVTDGVCRECPFRTGSIPSGASHGSVSRVYCIRPHDKGLASDDLIGLGTVILTCGARLMRFWPDDVRLVCT